ncbi:MAG: hypothetical protein E6J54_19770 [Deltaproteobacteria bacterium]|nr:MAG: hypothetical protein E6J54_19770 [Deltaproteobacteria bacterium]
MSRPLRIQYEGAVCHIMNRGRARQATFLGDQPWLRGGGPKDSNLPLQLRRRRRPHDSDHRWAGIHWTAHSQAISGRG